MLILKYVLLGVFGLAGGAILSSGLFALITSVGVINRYAKVTHTAKYVKLYETMVVLGASIGNILGIFDIVLNLGVIGCGIIGLTAGIYIGTFLVSLAETVKVIPIFIRRVRITTGLGCIILFLAIGKGIGGIMYFFLWYPK